MPRLPHWNWAAFLLTFIWGVGHRVWISLIAIIPGVNIIMAVILGIKGNAWAWRANPCLDQEEFIKNEKLWLKWAVITYAIVLILAFIFVYYASGEMKRLDAMETRDSQRIANVQELVSKVNKYKLNHEQKCPDSLQQLVPQYMSSVPLAPDGKSYDYFANGEQCTVSITLEDPNNTDLNNDSDPGNGQIYDQKAEDLSKLQNFSE